jgi:D-alanyl-D-alanine carboxypeptidase
MCHSIPNCPAPWKPITIHEVLTHTSGIRDLATQTVAASPAEALAPYNHVPLDFPPGTQYEYSNAGYILLGYIIQQVSGEPYASFIQQHILAPLHMNDTGFVPLPPASSHPAEALATGYTAWQVPAPPWVYDPPLPANMTFLYAHGYLYATAEDLQRWDQALFKPTLVSQRSLNAMFTPMRICVPPSLLAQPPTPRKRMAMGGRLPRREVFMCSGMAAGTAAAG